MTPHEQKIIDRITANGLIISGTQMDGFEIGKATLMMLSARGLVKIEPYDTEPPYRWKAVLA